MSTSTKRPGVARHSEHPAEEQNFRGKSCPNRVRVPTVNRGRSIAEILPGVVANILAWQREGRKR